MVSSLTPLTMGLQSPNVGQELLGAVSQGQQIRGQGLQNQARQQDVNEIDFQNNLRKLQIINRLATQAKQLPPEQRPGYIQSIDRNMLGSVGITTQDLANAPLDDAGLDQLISQTGSVIQGAIPDTGQSNMQRGQGAIVKTDKGLAYSTPVFNPKTGQIEEKVTSISGELVSREGETPDEKSQRAIDVTRGKKQAEQEVIGATQPEIEREVALAKENVKILGERRSQALKTGNQIEQLQSTIDQVEAIIPLSTGSGFGAIVDATGSFVGWTNDAAQNTAKLKALSGWMVSNIPRMEGPQSNIDVDNYRTMAGRIDDPIPAEERLAALQAIKEMMSKYKQIGDKWVDQSVIEQTGGSAKGANTPATTGNAKQDRLNELRSKHRI
jgi:hypothetical protein